jgi:hypothetical protein
MVVSKPKFVANSFIDQIFIHDQLGISYEGVVDDANATIKK